MANNQDYYQTLGIGKNASEQEIKAAYRKMALEWHPDRNKDPRATEKFKQVNEAYEVLSNPQKKQAYDRFGHAAFTQGAGQGPGGGYQQGPFTYSYGNYGGGQNPFAGFSAQGGPASGWDFGGFSDPFEIFEQFFGGGFSAAGQRRGRRATYSLGLTFMEAAKGTEKTVEISGKQQKLKIPAGVDDGTRVRFEDFDVVIQVWPDKAFQREGANIIVETRVDFDKAVLGTTIEVPTIDGPVTLKIPAGTQPDTVIRLRGRGIKIPRMNVTGDEFVRVKIKIPTRLNREQKELLEDYQKASAKKRNGWF